MKPTVQIDRDVPLPKRPGRTPKYPFADMNVGDSFWAPVTPETLQGCARRAGIAGAKFSTRAAIKIGVPGVGARCWRTA